MAASVGFECPSKHDLKPFRCSFMDGVMLRGFLLLGFWGSFVGVNVSELYCPFSPLWLSGVIVRRPPQGPRWDYYFSSLLLHSLPIFFVFPFDPFSVITH